MDLHVVWNAPFLIWPVQEFLDAEIEQIFFSYDLFFPQQVPQNYTPPAPITAPILAPLGADPQAQPMSTGGPQDVLQGLQGPQTPYSGMHQTQLPSQSMNASMPNSNMEGAPGAPTGDTIQVRTFHRTCPCRLDLR